MNIYYIDYENVSSQGLKGVELLTEQDEVILLYSKKADNVKIDILTMMMESKAKIRFMPVHVGTPNALDFQLVTLLFLNYKEENFCYIISKDSGYDCCIKTAAENGAANVARYPNIESAVNKVSSKRTRKGKSAVIEKPAAENPVPVQNIEPKQEAVQPNPPENDNFVRTTPEENHTALQEAVKEQARQAEDAAPAAATEDGTKKKPPRRRGRKKSVQGEGESRVTPAALAVKNDADKPVSILSVIRRRNDVQLDMHQIDLIRDALKNSSNKQQFYSYFVKKLGQKQGIELYHSVKSSYTDLVNANLI